jgi:hypothetical protein
VQVHDPETLHHVMVSDARLGSAIVPTAVIESIPLPQVTPICERLLRIANDIVAAGPPKIDLSGSKYMISNMLTDIHQCSDKHEVLSIGAELYKVLALHFLRDHGQWLVSKKMLPRALANIDPEFEKRFFEAFDALFSTSNTHGVTLVCNEVLESMGGSSSAEFRWVYPSVQRLKMPSK